VIDTRTFNHSHLLANPQSGAYKFDKMKFPEFSRCKQLFPENCKEKKPNVVN